MTRTLPLLVIPALLTLACPVRFDEQAYYDCGHLTGERAVACVLDDDCDTIMGSKQWTCRDRVCVKDCPDGFRCAADGYCKTKGKACAEDEFRCGAYCVPVASVPALAQICCNGCGEGEACCPFVDEAGVLQQNEVVCRQTRSDKSNCGGCGIVCAATENCINGKCLGVGQCDTVEDCVGFTDPICCDAPGLCFEKNTSDAHCGVCDRDCTALGQVCFGGSCITGTDQNCCGRNCTNCRTTGQYCDVTARTCASCVVGNQPDTCGAGNSCIYRSSSNSQGLCVPQATSTLPMFSACTASASSNPCRAGSACLSWSGAGSACMPLCNHTGSGAQVCNAIGPCRTFAAGWGVCMPRCPCPRADAPLFSTCQVGVDADANACVEEPYCSFASSAALGQPCDSVDCQPGLTCAFAWDPSIEAVVTNACAKSCSADGGCSEDAGETCKLPTGCYGVGYCD